MAKLLIVDDIEQNLYLLETLLKTNGYEVTAALNGIQALELARENPPDLIISDILMPGMDGFSLCRVWKADPGLKEIPFVIYSATYIDPRDENLAMNLGADRYIEKPLEPETILQVVREELENHKNGKVSVPKVPVEEKEVFLKQYNEALIRKLEDKMVQLQKSNRRLAELYQASCDLLSLRTSPELVRIILNVIVEKAGYQQVNYFTYDEDRKSLALYALDGYSQETFGDLKDKLNFKLGDPKGIAGMAAATGQTINIPNTAKDPNWIVIDPMIRSALFTPVIFEKRLLGVVGIFSNKLNAFEDEDVHDISVLANSLAMAIENNRNMEKSQKQLERISALHRIDTAINNSYDLQTILNIVLYQAMMQLKMDAADVLLLLPEGLKCKVAAASGFRTLDPGIAPDQVDRNLAENVIKGKRLVRFENIKDHPVTPGFAKLWTDEGFSTYIGIPLIAKGEVLGALELYSRDHFRPDEDWLELLTHMADQVAIAVDKAQMFEGLQHSHQELSLAYDATIRGWSKAMDLRDQDTEGHTQRVTELTVRLAEAMGLGGDDLDHIRHGALLHDIGKLSVPDAILLKPSQLDDEESAVMRRHPEYAYDLLKPINYLQPALDIPYCHHEKWDGTGYPRNLKGEEIPLAARIFTVIDVYDALSSDRPYRKAWPKYLALAYIREHSGTFFDPNIVKKFFELLEED